MLGFGPTQTESIREKTSDFQGDATSSSRRPVLLKEGSRYAWPMLVALIIAFLMQALATHFWQREGFLATLAAA